MIEYNNCCVECGEIIPEGRQVCSQCENGFYVLHIEYPPKKKWLIYWIKQYFTKRKDYIYGKE